MGRTCFQVVTSHSQETFYWGKRLADFLNPGDVLALYGELGSGKTVFVQGVCAGLNVHDFVTSPSYVLIQEYQGRMPVFHFDFYRLTGATQVEDLDVFRYWDSDGISLVEWADRGEMFLPEKKISITLDRIKENGEIAVEKRLIRFEGLMKKQFIGLRCECSGY